MRVGLRIARQPAVNSFGTIALCFYLLPVPLVQTVAVAIAVEADVLLPNPAMVATECSIPLEASQRGESAATP